MMELDRLNCAQATFLQVCERCGYKKEEISLNDCLSMCLPFGKGAGAGLVCGAVVGAFMAAGLIAPVSARAVSLEVAAEIFGEFCCLDCPRLRACADCVEIVDKIVTRTAEKILGYE